MKNLLALVCLMVFCCGLMAQEENKVEPGSFADAQKMLSAMIQPGADGHAMFLALRPQPEDYTAVFADELVAKLQAYYTPNWEQMRNGQEKIKLNKPEQTEVKLWAISAEDMKAWNEKANQLPGGYKEIKDQFKAGVVIYRFKFVKPGESLGMAYDGLVYVNGHWCIFPKPWRGARK